MGYPMSYRRVLGRNNLQPDAPRPRAEENLSGLPSAPCSDVASHIPSCCSRHTYQYAERHSCDDLRRWENDCRDDNFGSRLAEQAGVDLKTWKRCMDVLFCSDQHTGGYDAPWEVDEETKQRWKDAKNYVSSWSWFIVRKREAQKFVIHSDVKTS